jgi:hypothetical protein
VLTSGLPLLVLARDLSTNCAALMVIGWLYTVGLDLRGVAFDGTNIWVADNAADQVHKLAPVMASSWGAMRQDPVRWV